MPPRGQKPKPYALKEAEGFLGHRPHNPGVDLPEEDFASPMPLPAAAKKEWDRITEIAYWLRPSDAACLADRCLCWARLQEAEKLVKQRGMFIETERGLRANPGINVAKGYRKDLKTYDAELGLTPSSRTRVGSGTGDKAGSGSSKGTADAIERALCGQLPN
jgi:P27 family predicted phage terminase small subunit